MSIWYEVQKWTIVSMGTVAISLTLALLLVQYGHGIIINGSYFDDDAYLEKLKEIKQYCLDNTAKILAGGIL